jgi:hypothetical protein
MTTTVSRSDAQASCRIDDETVLMHLDSGRYFGYDAVGSRVWALMEEPVAVSTLCERLVAEYDGIDLEGCTRDVTAFLSELLEEGLVTVRDPEPI